MGDLFAFLGSVITQWVALGSGIVGLLSFLYERGWNVEMRWRTTRVIFVWGCLFVAVFLAWKEEHTRGVQLASELAQAKQSPPLPPDYITLHRPWLNAEVLISDYHDEAFRLLYEISNLGKLPAESMRLIFASSTMSRLDQSILEPRSIAPGASIFFEPNSPFRFETQRLKPFNSFILAIDYHARVAGTQRYFQSRFEMQVRIEDLKEGRLKPSAVPHADGPFTDKTIKAFLEAPFAR